MTPLGAKAATAVVYEDRALCLVGAMIAAASLRQQCPDLAVLLWAPGHVSELEQWAATRSITLRGDRPVLQGWNVKPGVLQDLLKDNDVVYWLDSDVLVTSDPRKVIPADPDIFVATEDTSWGQSPGSAVRCAAWGMSPGRDLAVTVNTGFMRVSAQHHRLLGKWLELLASSVYQDAQGLDVMQRPLHLIGDQEVLTALLGSHECLDEPMHLLTRGWDIAQCFGPDGFTCRERLRAVRLGHTPPLIHAMGMKPWLPPSGRGLRARYDRLHCDLHPYTALARRNGTAAAAGWFPPEGRPTRLLMLIMRSPLLHELPLSAVDFLVRSVRRRVGIGRFALAPSA